MNGQDYLSLVRNINRLGHSRNRLKTHLESLWLLWWLWYLPFSSSGDLAAHGVFSRKPLDRLVQTGADRGILSRVTFGSYRNRQDRFFLTAKGVYECQDRFGLPLAWSVTEKGLERLIGYRGLIEVGYGLLTGFWRSNATYGPLEFCKNPDPDADATVFDEKTRLFRLIWHRHGRVPIMAQYVNDVGSEISIPALWYGAHHGREPQEVGLPELFHGFDTDRDHWRPEAAPAPPGAIVVVVDRLAAFRVRRLYVDFPKAIVTVNGQVLEPMKPTAPEGRLVGSSKPAGPLGLPDKVAAWYPENLQWGSLPGVRERAIFDRIAEV